MNAWYNLKAQATDIFCGMMTRLFMDMKQAPLAYLDDFLATTKISFDDYGIIMEEILQKAFG